MKENATENIIEKAPYTKLSGIRTWRRRPVLRSGAPRTPPTHPDSSSHLPSFDYSAALEHAVRYSHPLSAVQGEKKEAILSQARFLLRCASKWSLTTGRHPLPLVAGLTALAAEVNVVTGVSMEDIAQDIFAVQHTSRRRYKELVDALVPLEGIVQTYSSVVNDESKYLQIVPLDDLDFNNFGQQGKESEGLKISEECLSDMYQNVLKKLSEVKELGKLGKGANKRKRWGRGLELDPWMDSQDDGWIKDVPLEEAADIDIGYDAPPPAFTANIELQKRRRGRIEAAKKKKGQKRIDGRNHEIQGDRPAETSNALNCRKRQKTGPSDGIDWEDCVIELLLLHGANEAEIEQGQYRRLLELHVFSSRNFVLVRSLKVSQADHGKNIL
ncbi:hypothetical protein BRADI_3g18765v3 [Brachypodium distachyon]|uniref:Uncharacterized protein n=1 Tax=Brachypodium distachyon TaxID=15368 RepID=A0A2K2CY34_BRADI|nr:hypothetical protein BRADI_3g18765v3 [Brachypodium distachyon]